MEYIWGTGYQMDCRIVCIVPSEERKQNAIVAQLVEYDLAKVGVAGSSPVSRSS